MSDATEATDTAAEETTPHPDWENADTYLKVAQSAIEVVELAEPYSTNHEQGLVTGAPGEYLARMRDNPNDAWVIPDQETLDREYVKEGKSFKAEVPAAESEAAPAAESSGPEVTTGASSTGRRSRST